MSDDYRLGTDPKDQALFDDDEDGTPKPMPRKIFPHYYLVDCKTKEIHLRQWEHARIIEASPLEKLLLLNEWNRIATLNVREVRWIYYM